MDYICYYTDLWTGEDMGASRGRVHLDNIPIHGHVALRVVCQRHLADENEP